MSTQCKKCPYAGKIKERAVQVSHFDYIKMKFVGIKCYFSNGIRKISFI